MQRVFLLLGCLLLLSGQAASQDYNVPFTGPLIATTRAEQRHILIYDLGTGQSRQLDVGAGIYTPWDFSPDGCRVLFTRQTGRDGAALLSMTIRGTDLLPLVDTSDLPQAVWDIWEPDWSPTGGRIAFTLSRPTTEGRESRIAWVPDSGGSPTFYSVAGDEHTPLWAPNGEQLAYVSYELRPAGADIASTAVPAQAESPETPLLREADLWTVSANGLTKERITRFDVGSAIRPRWSPDGETLAFVYVPSPGEHQFWIIAPVPGAIPTQLTTPWSQVLDHTWLPSGEGLLAAGRDIGGETRARLWEIPPMGGAEPMRYFEASSGLRDITPDYPRFSPDGAMLALREAYDLVVIDLETNTPRMLNGATGHAPPVWSPEAFTDERTCS